MGKRSSGGSKKNKNDKKKKKGPKGKKERAKVKLERQWGEKISTEPTVRYGKSRLSSSQPDNKNKKITSATTTATNKTISNNNDETLMKWNQSFVTKTEISQSSSSDDDDDDEYDSDVNSNEENQNTNTLNKDSYDPTTISNFISTIRNDTKKKMIHSNNDYDIDPLSDEDEIVVDDDDDNDTDYSGSNDNDDHPNNYISTELLQSIQNQSILMDPYNERFVQDQNKTFISENDNNETDDIILRNNKIYNTIIGSLVKIDSIHKKEQEQNQQYQQQQYLPLSTPLYNENNYEMKLSKCIVQKFTLLQKHIHMYYNSNSNSNSNDKNNGHDALPNKNIGFCTILSNIYYKLYFRTVIQLIYKRRTLLQQQQQRSLFNTYQSTIFPVLCNYSDLLITNATTTKRQDSIQTILLLHIMNHIITTRDRIYTHNKRIDQLANTTNDINNDDDNNTDKTRSSAKEINDDNIDDDWKRDQGYTRPTVLILLPTRSVCYQFVQGLISLLGNNNEESIDNNNEQEGEEIITNMNRFTEEYGPIPDDDNENDNDNDNSTNIAKKRKERKRIRRKQVLKEKGQEWNELFGDTANTDDDFKIGLSFVPRKQQQQQKKKKHKNKNNKSNGEDAYNNNSNNESLNDTEINYKMKLYTNFYISDIVLASPLGLKILASNDDDDDDNMNDNNESTNNNENDNNNNSNNSVGKADFLSSIEICIVVRSEVMIMQNWDHINDVLELLNQQPQKITSYTDFSRVRNYILNGYAKYYKQLIIVSSIIDPCIISTYKRYSTSISGQVKIRMKYSPSNSTFADIIIPNQHQIFTVIPTSVSFTNHINDRIKFFTKTILPQLLQQPCKKYTMLFIPSYFDYIAIRNILQKKGNDQIQYNTITEYTKNSDVTRTRAYFAKGYISLVLYTGRAHYYLRHYIKNVQHIIFFGLPEYPEFYSQLINRLEIVTNTDSNTASAGTNSNKNSSKNNKSTNINDNNDKTTCVSYFSKYESHALERIVGTTNCLHMIKNLHQSTFVFSS